MYIHDTSRGGWEEEEEEEEEEESGYAHSTVCGPQPYESRRPLHLHRSSPHGAANAHEGRAAARKLRAAGAWHNSLGLHRTFSSACHLPFFARFSHF